MSREELTAQSREILGKKVNRLRRDGILPATVYGAKLKGKSLQLPLRDFTSLMRSIGESELIDLKVEGEKEAYPVLIHEVQVEPLSHQPIHVDFYSVDLSKPVEVDVAIEIVGESQAVEEKRAVALQLLNELPIKVLPTEIPSEISVDISKLNEIGDQISAAELALPEGVEVMFDRPEDELIVKIDEIRVIEEEEEEETEEGVEGEEDKGTEDGGDDSGDGKTEDAE